MIYEHFWLANCFEWAERGMPLMETAKHTEKLKCICNLCTTRRGKYILVNNKEQTMKVETMPSLLLHFSHRGELENNRYHIIIATLL